MTAQITTPSKPPATIRGYDGAVVSREEDYLNRWPLAREIYGIATSGPNDWSVRIGIYGEWGTGKTSILEFITQMANADKHVLIHFNPWVYSNRNDLWCAFVLQVFAEPKLNKIKGTLKVRAKGWFSRSAKNADFIRAGTEFVHEKTGKAVGVGLDLIKSFFRFSGTDLKALQESLKDKRVIVLIDDLDRSAPELVPEILFALKELMNIPGFSFICAFDPLVVGKVLGRYHPGFGDGLKFLDKIIDYPRWLPPASPEGLASLAIADAKLSCPYVPETAIRDTIPLLPTNPRAVRQFIRLLALLKPQIERHHPHELRWPVILAANVLKIRHPRLAHALLDDAGFWDTLAVTIMAVRGDNESEKVTQAIDAHIKTQKDIAGLTLEPIQEAEVKAALEALSAHVGLFGGLHGDSAHYQFNITEAPAAVTWKEFDEFFTRWDSSQAVPTADTWINQHAKQLERTNLEVYRELLDATIRRYAEVLNHADNVLAETDKPALINQASSLFALLNALVFDLGHLDQPVKQIGDSELQILFETFASIARATMPVHARFWPRNEKFILKLVEQWSSDVLPLVRVLSPDALVSRSPFDSPAGSQLRSKLLKVFLPNFTRQVIGDFRQTGFVERLILKPEEDYETRSMLLDANGPFLGALRSETFKVLGEATSNRIVQENAYQLLHWFVLINAGHVSEMPAKMQRLLSDQSVFDAIWNAAIATPLSPRAVYNIRDLPNILKPFGTRFEPPPWWTQIMSTSTVPSPEAPSPEQTEPGDSPEDPS